ncbi:MAG: four helix bundle protein, partial [Verrucomicrobia bacterium]|nr:four helix bundle protein [Verrucomicrobiota bacterium]
AWANRANERQFISRLTDADGEQMETQHWIRVAFGCGYLDETEAREIIAQLDETGRLLNGMIAKAASFCATPPIRGETDTSHS